MSAEDRRELEDAARYAVRLPLAARPKLLRALRRAGIEIPDHAAPLAVWEAARRALYAGSVR